MLAKAETGIVNHFSCYSPATNPIHLIKCYEIPPGAGTSKQLHQTAHLTGQFTHRSFKT